MQMSLHKQVEITFRLKSIKVKDTIRDVSTNIKQEKKKKKRGEKKREKASNPFIA